MKEKEIELFITEILKNICEDDTIVVDIQADLNEDGINSLEFIRLLVQLEQHFNIEFPDEDLANERYVRLADLVNIVLKLIQ